MAATKGPGDEPPPEIDAAGTRRWRNAEGSCTAPVARQWSERMAARSGVNGARSAASAARQWSERGERHRVGGPAVVRADGTEEWWELGVPRLPGRR